MFNKHLYKEGLRRIKVMGLLYTIGMLAGSVLYPATAILNFRRQFEAGHLYGHMEMIQGGLDVYPFMLLAVYIAAPALTYTAFNFLNQRSSSDFFHSLPHKRETLFLNFIAAVLTWTLGAMWLSTAVATLIFSFSPHFSIAVFPTFLMGVGVSAAALLVMGGIALAMSLTGTGLANWAVAAMIMFLPRLLTAAFINATIHRSPVVTAQHFGIFSQHNHNLLIAMLTGAFFYNQPYQGILRQGIPYTLALGILYLAGAVYFFKKRRSELASNPGSRRTHSIARIALTFTATLLPLSIIVDQSSDSPFILGLYVVCLLGYFAYSFFTQRKLPRLKSFLPELAAILLLNGAFLGGVTVLSHHLLREINPRNVIGAQIQSGGQTTPGRTQIINQLLAESPQLAESLAETYNDNAAAFRHGDRWLFGTALETSFLLKSGQVQRLVTITANSPLADALLQYAPYRQSYLTFPRDFQYLWSWDALTENQARQVLDLLEEELPTVDFMDWYSLVGTFREGLDAQRPEPIGYINFQWWNGQTYDLFEVPITPLTPQTLALYLQFADPGN